MKIVIIIVFLLNVFEVWAEDIKTTNKNKTHVSLNSIKSEIDKYCLKCGKNKSASKIKELAIDLEHFLLKNPKEKSWYEAKELLIDLYSQLGAGFYNRGDKERVEYYTKYKNTIKQLVEEERYPSPEVLFLAMGIEEDEIKRRQLLNRVLLFQSYLFTAKMMEGYDFIYKEKNIQKGLESLTLAVYLANSADAHYVGEDLASLLKKYDRKELALVILKKTFSHVKDEKRIEKMLENME